MTSNDVFSSAIVILNDPTVRAVVTAAALSLSLISLGVTIWLTRRTAQLFNIQEQHYLVDQTRFIGSMWQASNAVVLSDERHFAHIKDMFGYEDERDVVRAYLLYNTMNPVYAAWISRENGTMPADIFEATRDNILSNFAGDRTWLLATLTRRGYAPAFVRHCREWLDRRDEQASAVAT